MKALRRALARIRQGLLALTAFAWPVDTSEAAALLTPEQMHLFERMGRTDRLHSLRVMKTLRAQGHTDPDLLVAALLHDVGKSRSPYGLFDRVLVVLVAAFAPRKAERWGEGRWRHTRLATMRGIRHRFLNAFYVARHHAEWSSQDMLKAGASERAAELARRHQYPLRRAQSETDELLAALQAVDDDG